MTKTIVKIALLCAIFCLINACSKEVVTDRNGWKKADNLEVIKISELKKLDLYQRVYETEGYVIDSFYCECPGNANCTCPPSKIIISEFNSAKNKERTLRLLTHTRGFQKGQKYGFLIEVTKSNRASKNPFDFYLIAYRKK